MINPIKKSFFIFLLWLCQVDISPVYAWVDWYSVVGDKKGVILNYSLSAYHAYSVELVNVYGFEAAVLNEARRELVRQKKIETIPVIFHLPLGIDDSTVIVRKDKKPILYYDEETKKPLATAGYVSTVPNNLFSHQNLLVLLSELKTWSFSEKEPIKLTAEKLRTHFQKLPVCLKEMTRFFDPLWAPNSHSVAGWFWENGKVRLEIRSIDGNIFRLESLKETPLARPVWSPDSNYLAFSSREKIKVCNLKTRNIKTIKLANILPRNMGLLKGEDDIESRTQVMMAFQGKSNPELIFAFDQIQEKPEWRRIYLMFNYDVMKNKSSFVTVKSNRKLLPGWAARNAKKGKIDFDIRQVISPDGKWLSRFVIKDLKDSWEINSSH